MHTSLKFYSEVKFSLDKINFKLKQNKIYMAIVTYSRISLTQTSDTYPTPLLKTLSESKFGIINLIQS